MLKNIYCEYENSLSDTIDDMIIFGVQEKVCVRMCIFITHLMWVYYRNALANQIVCQLLATCTLQQLLYQLWFYINMSWPFATTVQPQMPRSLLWAVVSNLNNFFLLSFEFINFSSKSESNICRSTNSECSNYVVKSAAVNKTTQAIE